MSLVLGLELVAEYLSATLLILQCIQVAFVYIYIRHTLIVHGQLGMCDICIQLLGHVHSHVLSN